MREILFNKLIDKINKFYVIGFSSFIFKINIFYLNLNLQELCKEIHYLDK